MSAIGLPGGRAFGEVLKAQRRAKGLSLRTLALQVSMSYSYLGMLEAGPVPAPVV
jgi:cytoskeletal protein RodZ